MVAADVDEPPPCNEGVYDIRVNVGAKTDIFLVTFPTDPDEPPTSRRIGLSELTSGQRVDVYGKCLQDGAVAAEDVIAFEGTPPDGSF